MCFPAWKQIGAAQGRTLLPDQ